jgi:hypothetical protein
MRLSGILFLIVGGMLLSVSACGGSNVGHGPPAINHDALIAKWQAREKEQLFQTLEFKGDKSFKLTLWQLQSPVTGTYSWNGNNSVTLDYQMTDDGKNACKEALAAYRQHIKDRAEAGGGQYKEQISNSSANFTDDLIDKQEWRVGLVEGAKPELTLRSAKGLEFSFKKPE